ncbi:ketol-acid reductoisomerase [Candidatus Marinimicrobia bacterium]|nr:ketol-acid reductoisomerase [Candidatus Neomarinimicrobiota bacterium]
MKNSTLFFEDDICINIIKDKKIGIIGYGNQGRAQALNLQDSSLDVIVGIRECSKSIELLKKDNVAFDSIESVVSKTDVLCMLVPDSKAVKVFNNNVKPYLSKGQTLLFSHGYNIHYNLINCPDDINIIMVAPSGGGAMVRSEYKKGSGVPSLIAVNQNYSGHALDIAKAYAKLIGSARICCFLSTFKEETETDLYGEQVLLTGAIPMIIEKSLKVLLDNGYSPVVAWFVCYYEVKMIVDLFHRNGFEYLYKAISDTAKYGGLKSGKYLIDDEYENKLKVILDNIRTGKFKKELDENVDTLDYNSELDAGSKDEILKLMKVLFKKDDSLKD